MKRLISKFSEFTSDLSEYPELDGMPKETWFWAVKENGNVVGLVDTNHSDSIHDVVLLYVS